MRDDAYAWYRFVWLGCFRLVLLHVSILRINPVFSVLRTLQTNTQTQTKEEKGEGLKLNIRKLLKFLGIFLATLPVSIIINGILYFPSLLILDTLRTLLSVPSFTIEYRNGVIHMPYHPTFSLLMDISYMLGIVSLSLCFTLLAWFLMKK